ncbi:hypothetical protein D3C73_1275500 [compost metagenome]
MVAWHAADRARHRRLGRCHRESAAGRRGRQPGGAGWLPATDVDDSRAGRAGVRHAGLAGRRCLVGAGRGRAPEGEWRRGALVQPRARDGLGHASAGQASGANGGHPLHPGGAGARGRHDAHRLAAAAFPPRCERTGAWVLGGLAGRAQQLAGVGSQPFQRCAVNGRRAAPLVSRQVP